MSLYWIILCSVTGWICQTHWLLSSVAEYFQRLSLETTEREAYACALYREISDVDVYAVLFIFNLVLKLNILESWFLEGNYHLYPPHIAANVSVRMAIHEVGRIECHIFVTFIKNNLTKNQWIYYRGITLFCDLNDLIDCRKNPWIKCI